MIPLTEEDIYIIPDDEGYNVKFMSLEGYDVVWTKEEAEELKLQILSDQESANAMHNIQVMLAQTGKSPKEILEHFAKQKEKAEKWDKRGNIFKSISLTDKQSKRFSDEIDKSHFEVVSEVMKDNDKLEQENKQLKEIVDGVKMAVVDWPADSYCDIDASEDCAKAVKQIRELLAGTKESNEKELPSTSGIGEQGQVTKEGN